MGCPEGIPSLKMGWVSFSFSSSLPQMVMNKLIEPGLKPVPLEGIFLCSIVLIVFKQSSAFISGGRGLSLSTSLTSHGHDLRSGKKQNGGHFVYMF